MKLSRETEAWVRDLKHASSTIGNDIEVNGEIVKSYAGDVNNRNCVRCTAPELHKELGGEEEQLKAGHRDNTTAHEVMQDGKATTSWGV